MFENAFEEVLVVFAEATARISIPACLVEVPDPDPDYEAEAQGVFAFADPMLLLASVLGSRECSRCGCEITHGDRSTRYCGACSGEVVKERNKKTWKAWSARNKRTRCKAFRCRTMVRGTGYCPAHAEEDSCQPQS